MFLAVVTGKQSVTLGPEEENIDLVDEGVDLNALMEMIAAKARPTTSVRIRKCPECGHLGRAGQQCVCTLSVSKTLSVPCDYLHTFCLV